MKFTGSYKNQSQCIAGSSFFLVNVGGTVKSKEPVAALGATDEPNVIVNIDDFMDKKLKL